MVNEESNGPAEASSQQTNTFENIEEQLQFNDAASPSSPNPMTPPRFNVTWPHVHHPVIIPFQAEKPEDVRDPRLNRVYPSHVPVLLPINPDFDDHSDNQRDATTSDSPASPCPVTPPRLNVTWPHVHHPKIVPLEAENPDAVSDPRLNRTYPSRVIDFTRLNTTFNYQRDATTSDSPASPCPVTPPRLNVTWPHVHHPKIVPLEAKNPDAVSDPRLNRTYPSRVLDVVPINTSFNYQRDRIDTMNDSTRRLQRSDDDEEPPCVRRRSNEEKPIDQEENEKIPESSKDGLEK